MAEPKNYTWDDAARDLALLSHLTHMDALHLVRPLREVPNLSPYDATYWIQQLVTDANPQGQGAAIYALLASKGDPQ